MVPRFYRLSAGTLTQLEMFQKRLKVLRRTLGHSPSLGVFCWLEVTDFDRFFGSPLLVLHVCYLSFAGLFMVCSSLQEYTMFITADIGLRSNVQLLETKAIVAQAY